MISDLMTDIFVWLLPLPVVSFSSDNYQWIIPDGIHSRSGIST